MADSNTTPYTPPAPLKGKQLLVGTLALSAATFMNVLDSSIANVSIPTISGDLGVSSSQGTWVITSFAVANAISIPLTGWLTQRFGQVRLFTLSILLFVLASWLCGLAPNIESLLLFRVFQGLVAGPMIPLSQSLMLSSYPKEKAPIALALWGMTTLVAPVMGPILGGWISDNYTWPWIFYINIPVGLVTAFFTWSLFKSRETPTRKLPIDTVGLALLVTWVATLQIMLDKGKELDWFASTQIVVLTVISAITFVFFLIWELTEENPIIDLRLFMNRNFTTGVIATSVAFGIFFGTVVLQPLWLQMTLGYTAFHAGLATAPVGILAIILTPIVGKLIGKVDARSIATFAFIIFSLISWMRSSFTPDIDMYHILIPTVIQGAAMATFFIPLVTITLSEISPDKIASASGLSNFVRITGSALGTSIATTQWDNRSALHHANLVEHIEYTNSAFNHYFEKLTDLGMNYQQAMSYLDQMISVQAQTKAILDIFFVSSIIFIILIPLIWMSHKIKSHGASAEASAAH